MKKSSEGSFLLSLVCCLLSCNQNKNQIPTVGTLDSAAIARDTTMQKGFESSYEFHKTLSVHEKLVYDVVGYGGSASMGEYAILRRSTDNIADTVAKAQREGLIANAFVADLNGNHNEEVYIITQSAGSGSYGNVIAYEFNAKGEASPLNLEDFTKAPKGSYRGHDSIYISSQEIIREYPAYNDKDPNCCPTGSREKIHYLLVKNKLVKADNIAH